jgi:hypothetical protein
VLVFAVAAVGIVAPTLRQGSDAVGQPDIHASQLALPTEISQPSPWESGTSGAGPLGPLAVLGEDLGRHTSWFNTGDAYYGISAADGTYRYLDLPGLDTTSTPVLSPDGSHIAYWTVAPPSTDPRAIGGYAVYDAVSGTTTEHALPSTDDLRPRVLTWSPDGDQLFVEYDGLSQPDSRVAGGQILSLADGVARDLTLPALAQGHRVDVAWGPPGVAFWRPPHLVVVDPLTGAFDRSDHEPQGARYSRGLAWSPSGSAFAVTATFRDPGGPYLQVNSLGVVVVDQSRPRGIERVSPFDAVYQVLGWRDDRHVLVVGVPTETDAARADTEPGVYSIDAQTGAYERLGSVSLSNSAWIRGVATGLADRPFAERPGPAGHPDPRAVWARVAALLVVAFLVGLVVRQTRRARDPARPLAGGPA